MNEIHNQPTFPALSQNSLQVLRTRYLKKDCNGEVIETPEELFERVATSIASAEQLYSQDPTGIADIRNQFLHLMLSGKFMPNSPTLMNAGREMGMLSACFVLPMEDSIEGIFSTIKATALIQKAGGGTGFSFDKLRPTGDYISTSGGTTSGPISFWKVLAETTNAIQQGAFRRGANMGMMSITHPDILKFITSKQKLDAFTNFNISIKITDAWMTGLQEEPAAPHHVINPRTQEQFYIPSHISIRDYTIHDLIPCSYYDEMDGNQKPQLWSRQQIYDLILNCAWATGEPGLIFIDAINRANPTPHIGSIEATNPCGEQPLLDFEACNLGSINVARFVTQTEDGTPLINWEDLKQTVYGAVRFLDNVIDINNYPVPEIETMCKGNRKIGLGIMGFADLLYTLSIPYTSDHALQLAEDLMRFITEQSHDASHMLSQERGPFPNWQGSMWDKEYNKPMRNAATTTVAPTGTISIIADCSGGIEPMFSLAFFRNILDGKKLLEVNPVFKTLSQQQGFYSEQLIERIAQQGTIQHIDSIPDDVKSIFVCSHDIPPQKHVQMQAAFQRYCDSSISKTINLPHDATQDQIKEIYLLAWRLGCKGVTVYRDGCRMSQPMALSASKPDSDSDSKTKGSEQSAEQSPPHTPLKPVKTPAILSAIRIRQNTPFGHMHVTITVDPKKERELEVFAQLGKAGDVVLSDLEAISRLISLYLRIGGSLEQIINQLEGIGSHLSIPTKDGRVMSIADGLGKTLKRYLDAKKTAGLKNLLTGAVDFDEITSMKSADTSKTRQEITEQRSSRAQPINSFKVKCPECHDGILNFSEGCVKCQSCGYSQC